MGNTHSTVKPKKEISTKSSKHVNVIRSETIFTAISTRTTESIPSKPARSSLPTNKDRGSKSIDYNVHPNGTASLPPSPTQSDPSTIKELKSAEMIIVNGRKYQNHNTKYVLPLDEQEQDRLVQVHFIYKHIFGGNFSAPVRDLLSGSCHELRKRNSAEWSIKEENSPKVLDIACGNGTWILEMATEFPNSHFYGIDFAANYPTAIKPSNTFFSQHDILNPKGLPFPDNYFDFVHMRQVYTCFSKSDWSTVVLEIKRVLKPGGFVECRDIDPMLKNMGPSTERLFKNYPSLMKERHGVDVFWSKNMYNYLQKVGEMTDMHEEVHALPFGATTGPVGDMTHASLRSGLESYRLFFINSTNKSMTDAEYDKIIDDIVNETIERHSFFTYYSCWGRKPLFEYQNNIPDKYSPNIISNNNSPTTPNNMSRNPSSSSVTTLPVVSPIPADVDDSETKYIISKLTSFTWEDRTTKDDFSALGSENVSDIDQFVAGFED